MCSSNCECAGERPCSSYGYCSGKDGHEKCRPPPSPCPSGAMQTSTGCIACPPGQYSSEGASSCQDCPSGFYCPGGMDKKPCPPGQFSPPISASCYPLTDSIKKGTWVSIQTNLGTTKMCIDVPDGTFKSGTSLQQYKCNASPAQQFLMVPVDDTYATYELQASTSLGGGTSSSRLCLNVKGGMNTQGAEIILFECTGALNERFQLVDASKTYPPQSPDLTGYYALKPQASDQSCVDISSWSSKNGTKVVQWSCNYLSPDKKLNHGGDNRNQRFRLLCGQGSYGTYWPNCTLCPPQTYNPPADGTYFPELSSFLGVSSCHPCPQGTFSSEGSLRCSPNPPPPSPFPPPRPPPFPLPPPRPPPGPPPKTPPPPLPPPPLPFLPPSLPPYISFSSTSHFLQTTLRSQRNQRGSRSTMQYALQSKPMSSLKDAWAAFSWQCVSLSLDLLSP